MATNLLNTVTEDYGQLIGNGRIYRVPHFQRTTPGRKNNGRIFGLTFSVSRKRLSITWLCRLPDNRRQELRDYRRATALHHVEHSGAGRHENIGDLADDNVDPEPNRERVEELRRQFIGYKDPAALTTSSRLFLNRNNDDFYQSYLIRLRKPAAKSRLKPSERLMWDAFEYFCARLKEPRPRPMARFGAVSERRHRPPACFHYHIRQRRIARLQGL